MPTRDDFVVSTTSDLQGWKIDEYLGIVSAHVVMGTNIFSDVFASFSDIFGGRSKTYQNQLTSIDEEIIQALREEAINKGANGLIGARVDYDEISGSGKSMFMVTAAGTAVRATRTQKKGADQSAKSNGRLSSEELEILIRRNKNTSRPPRVIG